MILFSFLFACSEDKSTTTDNQLYCFEDATQNLISEDGDCDGILTADDCDDDDASSTVVAQDGDCDGTVATEDCDDTDPQSATRAEDGDCDGVLTIDDCDDGDADNSLVITQDYDCDGVLTEDDCDDGDASSTVVAQDGDCDGVLTIDDCDDGDASSTVVAQDGDCDGTVATEDCDDTDPQSATRAEDGDCDGVLTIDDCDDGDADNSLVITQDYDCDGVLTEDDCDDGDASSTVVAQDGDCDGVLTIDDCDDADPQSATRAEDGDCDGVLTTDDCDDNDASVYPGAPDVWYDGIDSDCGGENDYDQDMDGYTLLGSFSCSDLQYTTEQDCTSNGGLWTEGFDCDDDNANRHPLPLEPYPDLCYKDADNDGYGDNTLGPAQQQLGLTEGLDCDDSDALTYYGAGYNEPSPKDMLCLRDADGDGYGEPVQGTCYSITLNHRIGNWPPNISGWIGGNQFSSSVGGQEVLLTTTDASFCARAGEPVTFTVFEGNNPLDKFTSSVTWLDNWGPNQTYCSSCYRSYDISTSLYYFTLDVEEYYMNYMDLYEHSFYTQTSTEQTNIAFYETTAGDFYVLGSDSNDQNANVH